MYSLGPVAVLLAVAWQLLHVLPPVVGLVLVLRVRTKQRWRTWALWSFGLALGAGLVSAVITAAMVAGLHRPGGTLGLLSGVQGAVNLVGVVAAFLGVAAVLADRSPVAD